MDVIILAAGNSLRFDNNLNKLLFKIGNLRIIEFSIIFFKELKIIDNIIIVCNDEIKKILSNKYNNLIYTPGGKTRNMSMYNGFKF